MPYPRDRRKHQESETVALDLLAVTLAIWLGVVVSITALGRLAQDAQAQATLRGDPAQAVTQLGEPSPFIPLGS